MNNLENKKILGIIVEYNPMHNGHIYHIQKAKELINPDYVIAIMSGNFTQQGNISCINKFTKAKIACQLGVDLILELPTYYAISSSENFSFGAVKILDSLNCVTHICFGAECNNIEELNIIAQKLIDNEKKILDNTKNALKQGMNVATARDNVLKTILTHFEYLQISKPNNILGLEYLCSLKKLNSKILPVAIQRSGDDHNSTTSLTSSSGIRNQLEQDNLENISKAVPSLIFDQLSKKQYLLNDKLWNIFCYETIRLNVTGLTDIHDVDLGLATRLYTYSLSTSNMEEFIHKVKCKSYTMSRIKRCILYVILNITKDAYAKLVTTNYARVLATSNRKKEILSIIAKTDIPVISRLNYSIINNLPHDVQEGITLDIFATNLYNLIANIPNATGDYTNKL